MMCLQSCPAAIPTGHCPAPRAVPAQGLNLGVWGCLTIPSVLNGNCQALNSTDTTNLPTSLGGTGTTPGKVANSLNCKGSAGAMPEAMLGLLGPGVVGPCQLRMFWDPVDCGSILCYSWGWLWDGLSGGCPAMWGGGGKDKSIQDCSSSIPSALHTHIPENSSWSMAPFRPNVPFFW